LQSLAKASHFRGPWPNNGRTPELALRNIGNVRGIWLMVIFTFVKISYETSEIGSEIIVLQFP